MKKNKMMRTAAVLGVAALITTSALSGTLAKYTTTSTGNDSARVAKWGFQDTSSITLDDLFKNVYDADDNATVKSSVDVIAPGTASSAKFKFNYTGTETKPEVAYTFTVDTKGSSCDQSIQDNTNIQWKLDNGSWGTWSQLLAAIQNLDGTSGETGKQYEAGTLPTEFAGETEHTVAWQWGFDKDAKDGTFIDLDTTDTEMSNAAELANVKLVINITATQID